MIIVTYLRIVVLLLLHKNATSFVSRSPFQKANYLSQKLQPKENESKISQSLNSKTPLQTSIKGPCIGIDLGTTYRCRYLMIQILAYILWRSCVAALKNGRVEICPNEMGNRITPSWVSWDTSGVRVIGDAAKRQASVNPLTTVYDIKRLIGRKWSDVLVKQDAKSFPFNGTNSGYIYDSSLL